MKKYQITLQVPDDFDPNQMDMSISYPEEDAIDIEREEFFDISDIVNQLTVDIRDDVSPSSVALFKFPVELDPEVVNSILWTLEHKLGCTVVGLVNDLELLIQNSAEAITMLRGMIDKINAKAIIKLS